LTVASHQRSLEVAGDNYKNTVLALRAFANELLFDDTTRAPLANGSVHCGRKFKTSAKNKRSKLVNVTPDLTVILPGDMAVIAEAKLGFHSDEKLFAIRVDQTIEQIEKYDDDLSGWPRSTKSRDQSSDHDLAVLINFEDARKAARELQVRRDKGTFAVSRKLAVVSIARIGRSEGEWPTLTLEAGELSDEHKTQKLQDRVVIRPGVLARSPYVGLVEFCDEEPPLPVMMDLVHKAIVTNLTPEEQEEYNIEGQVSKRILAAELCRWLSKYAFKKSDRHDPRIPRPKWVSEALAELIAIGWAEHMPGKPKSVVYHHRKRRKNYNNPYGRFIEFYAKKRQREEEKYLKRREREKAKKKLALEKAKKGAPLFADKIDEEYRSEP